MKDHLRSLVQRARGEAAPLRPVSRPSFAPLPANLGSPPGYEASAARSAVRQRGWEAGNAPPIAEAARPAAPSTDPVVAAPRKVREATAPAHAPAEAPRSPDAGHQGPAREPGVQAQTAPLADKVDAVEPPNFTAAAGDAEALADQARPRLAATVPPAAAPRAADARATTGERPPRATTYPFDPAAATDVAEPHWPAVVAPDRAERLPAAEGAGDASSTLATREPWNTAGDAVRPALDRIAPAVRPRTRSPFAVARALRAASLATDGVAAQGAAQPDAMEQPPGADPEHADSPAPSRRDQASTVASRFAPATPERADRPRNIDDAARDPVVRPALERVVSAARSRERNSLPDEAAASDERAAAPARSRRDLARTDRPARPVDRWPEPAEPPTIHVSIGRIEVRAMQPAAPPRAAPASPRLTLDEYLRRRNEGGAR